MYMLGPRRQAPIYKLGYDDGFQRNEKQHPLNIRYMAGYEEGTKDKDFCDAYSDEAMGVEGYGP